MNVSDHLLSAGAPADPAVIDARGSHSYSDLRSAVARCAADLVRAELPPGSRVAVMGPNSLFWVAAYLAIMRLGHVAVPVPDRARAEDVGPNLTRVDCRAALVDRRSLRALSGFLPDRIALFTDEVLASHGASQPQDEVADDTSTAGADAALMFTSGTTAGPRAVRITHANIIANTESVIASLGLRREDRALVILPFHYCFGASVLHTHLRVGGCLVLCDSFAYPETAVELLDTHGCTVFAGVPSSYQLLLRASSFARRRLDSLRLLQAAGGRLPESIVEELLSAAPQAELFLMYGQTEATARLSCLHPSKLPAKKGSIGNGIPGVELRVLAENGVPVPPGQPGEIYARGANISPGYLDDQPATAARFTEHGLRTGDLAVVDEDGDIWVVDRREDFIKSWGHRISSQRVEACVLSSADVIHAAAVGVPDEAAGEAVTLFLVPRPGAALTEAQVLALCRQQLPRHEVPRSVVFMEAMPLTPSGKVMKKRLRELGASA